jgi:hypothetical protein
MATRNLRRLCLLGAIASLSLSVACRLDMLLKTKNSPPPVLSVTPTEVRDSARAGSNDMRHADVAITSSGVGTFTWSASEHSSWIHLDPHEGDVPATLTISLDPQDLAPGVYEGDVTVTATEASDTQSTTIAVTFFVQRPGLSVSPALIEDSTNVNSNAAFTETLQVTNSGTGQLSWTASGNRPWLMLGATSGSGNGTIPVTINSTGLVAGTYHGDIVITAPGATGSPAHVSVTLTVGAPGLAVSPGFVHDTAPPGSTTPQSQTLQVSNSGTGTLTWIATKSQPWVALSKTGGGAPDSITVTVDPTGLPPGTQTDTVVFTSAEATNGPVKVPVELVIALPGLVVTPPTISATADASDPKRQQFDVRVTNSAGGTLVWFASADSSWISVNPSGGLAPSTLTVTIDPRAMGPGPRNGPVPGTHTGSVTVTAPGVAGSPFVVPVQLVVTTKPCGEIPLDPDVVRTSPLDAGDCEAPDRPGSFANLYSLSANAGDTLSIRFASSDLDAYLILTDAVGNVLVQNDECPGETGTACIPGFLITTGGKYFIEGTSTVPGATGSVTITVIRKRPGGSPPRQP